MPHLPRLIRPAALTAPILLSLALWPGASSPASPSQQSLHSTIDQQRRREATLSAGASSLGQAIAQLSTGLGVLEQRVSSAQSALQSALDRLAQTRKDLAYTRQHLVALRLLLARNRAALADELRAQYTQGRPELVDIVLNATSFSDLLNQTEFLHRVAIANAHVVEGVRHARNQTGAETVRLATLGQRERDTAAAVQRQRDALVSQSSALQARRDTLAQARAAQQAALQASVVRGSQLKSQIGRIEAEQAAAARAAAAAAAAAQQAATASPTPVAVGPSLCATGGWAIPYAIVLCESGGQNMTPNSAGASGYYQIIPSTWKLFGGSGPAAYLASKAEQDAVASRIWNGGAGASNWVCAGIVGIH
jgi:peptidoglycan hydrolase CwlO-like protein